MVEFGDFTSGREVIWAGAYQLIMEHPVVGFGPRSFVSIFPLFDKMPVRGVGSWHNDYLQVYLDSGLITLLPLLWLLVATYYYSWRMLPSLSIGERRLALSMLVSLSAVFLFGGILDTHVGIVFRILLAFLALLMSKHRRGRRYENTLHETLGLS
jgi:O-antigen ligase